MNNPSKNKFFKKAIEIIKTHPYCDQLGSVHASVIVKGGNIIATGINKPKRNSFIHVHRHHDGCNVHSECDAILQGRKKSDLRGSTIYVARIRKDNNKTGFSRPCLMCCRVLKSYGIKKVYYTTNGGGYKTMGRREINNVVNREAGRVGKTAA